MSLPSTAEQKELLPLLDELARTVEDLLLTGLAAASERTQETLGVSFRAASEKRLLRLGSTLRVAVEEIGRYARGDPHFSRRRFTFFVSRAWALSKGMHHALRASNERQWNELTGQPPARIVEGLEVVTLGVVKRVVPNAFAAFEFRLRALSTRGGVGEGSPLVWSCVFPVRAHSDVPAEAYLHLPQKQKFKAAELLPGSVASIGPVLLGENGRFTLNDESTVEVRKERFEDWSRFRGWRTEETLRRVREHRPGPFDLEVELQEDVVLADWRVGDASELDRERQLLYPIHTPYGAFFASVGMDEDAAPLRTSIDAWKSKRERPPLFGLLHFEMCRVALQPLTVLDGGTPDSLTLSKDSFDPAALVRSLDFR